VRDYLNKITLTNHSILSIKKSLLNCVLPFASRVSGVQILTTSQYTIPQLGINFIFLDPKRVRVTRVALTFHSIETLHINHCYISKLYFSTMLCKHSTVKMCKGKFEILLSNMIGCCTSLILPPLYAKFSSIYL
jgi:hypothetical protein